jgi:hypothetical protein
MAFEAAATVDDADVIRELLGILEGVAAGELTRSLRAQQARFRARLPDYDTESELATAERFFRELEMPFYVSVVQLERAEWLAGQGRADEAAPLLADAQETFERLEAKPWLERAAQTAPVGREPESVTTG